MTTSKHGSPLPSSSARKPVHANPNALATAPNFRRAIGSRVGYGDTALGRHVAGMRTVQHRPPPPTLDPSMTRNIAAARLSDGRVLDGVSGDPHGCSENQIQSQLDTLNQGRTPPLTIEELYTERQPCCNCENLMNTKHPGADVNWTVEHFDVPGTPATPEEAKALRQLKKLELAELKRVAYTYHGI
jgi:hypothetical protein